MGIYHPDLSYILEADDILLRKKSKSFKKDANDYIDSLKGSYNKNLKIAEGFLLASAGITLLGLLLASTAPVASLITSIGGIILSIISMVYSIKAQKYYQKIENLKSRLLRMKSEASGKNKSAISDLIDRVDNEIDLHYKNKPQENINHNYNY